MGMRKAGCLHLKGTMPSFFVIRVRYFVSNSCTDLGQQGMKQKALIQRNYRGFVYRAFRLPHLMLAAVVLCVP